MHIHNLETAFSQSWAPHSTAPVRFANNQKFPRAVPIHNRTNVVDCFLWIASLPGVVNLGRLPKRIVKLIHSSLLIGLLLSAALLQPRTLEAEQIPSVTWKVQSHGFLVLRTQEGKSLAAGDLIQVVVRAENGSYLGAAFIPLLSLAMLDSYVYAYREPWPNCGAFEDFLGGVGKTNMSQELAG